MYRDFPCVLCGTDSPDLVCPGCDRDLPRLSGVCARCGVPSPASTCIACVLRPPRWDFLVVPYSFIYPVDKIVHAFKYQGAVFWAPYLAREMARRGLALNIPLPEAFIPVPAHGSRLSERGFNQAVELARGIGRELDIPVITDAVARMGSHAPQVGSSAANRLQNVRGAFTANRRRAFTWHSVAIVDDILTTGATARELGGVLQRLGANQIQVWVVARTPFASRMS